MKKKTKLYHYCLFNVYSPSFYSRRFRGLYYLRKLKFFRRNLKQKYRAKFILRKLNTVREIKNFYSTNVKIKKRITQYFISFLLKTASTNLRCTKLFFLKALTQNNFSSIELENQSKIITNYQKSLFQVKLSARNSKLLLKKRLLLGALYKFLGKHSLFRQKLKKKKTYFEKIKKNGSS